MFTTETFVMCKNLSASAGNSAIKLEYIECTRRGDPSDSSVTLMCLTVEDVYACIAFPLALLAAFYDELNTTWMIYNYDTAAVNTFCRDILQICFGQ